MESVKSDQYFDLLTGLFAVLLVAILKERFMFRLLCPVFFPDAAVNNGYA